MSPQGAELRVPGHSKLCEQNMGWEASQAGQVPGGPPPFPSAGGPAQQWDRLGTYHELPGRLPTQVAWGRSVQTPATFPQLGATCGHLPDLLRAGPCVERCGHPSRHFHLHGAIPLSKYLQIHGRI